MTVIRNDDGPVVASLATFATLPSWLAAGMDGNRVADELVTVVPEFTDGRLRLVSCVPERLRAKGEEWLARYRLQVSPPTEAQHEVVLVGILWAPGQEAPPAARETGGSLKARNWRGWLAGLRLQLRLQESDEALPALPTLTQPEAAARLLEPIVRQAGYPDAIITSCDPEVVRYKPGSRCTVIVRLGYAPGGDRVPPSRIVLKTHQGDKGQTAWTAMTALWDRPEAWRNAVSLAEPLAYRPGDRILAQGPIAEEQTLKELAREAIATASPVLLTRLRKELAGTAAALAAIHRSGVRYERRATFEEELAEVREVIDRLAVSVPELATAAEPLVGRLAELAVNEPAGQDVPAHHDFRPAQVLLDNGRLGFIDFDGASMAEPALDLGRFRAKLRDIGISALAASGGPLSGLPLAENLELLDDLCEHFLASYQEHLPVSRTRVLLWETCDLLTAVLHSWTKVLLARVEPRLTVLLHQAKTNGLLIEPGRAAA